ncbi:MAG TPA: isoprenylcysteine carboxylmethyltransferase family protein [Chloroflexota bacterium]
MGPHWFYHHPVMQGIWIATYSLQMAPETICSFLLRSAKDAKRADRGSKIIVIASITLGIVAAFWATFRLPRFAMGPEWEALFVLGIAVWLGGILFRFYSMRVLGRFFTYDVAISKGQHIVEIGPYRVVRHPSYLGGLIASIGLGMTMTNWAALLLPLCCSAIGYAYRIPIEERALVQGLGEPYVQYIKRTWRLVPHVF